MTHNCHIINGNFFLGIGNINGKIKHTFYYRIGGYYKIMVIDHDKVKIKYIEDEPKVNIIEKYPTGPGDAEFPVKYHSVENFNKSRINDS